MTATTIPRKTRSTPLKISPPGPVCAAYKTFAVQTKPSAEFRKPAPVPERCAKPAQAQSKTASPTTASALPPLQAPAEDCCATTARHKPENSGDTAPNHKSYTLREPPHCATRPEMRTPNRTMRLFLTLPSFACGPPPHSQHTSRPR